MAKAIRIVAGKRRQAMYGFTNLEAFGEDGAKAKPDVSYGAHQSALGERVLPSLDRFREGATYIHTYSLP